MPLGQPSCGVAIREFRRTLANKEKADGYHLEIYCTLDQTSHVLQFACRRTLVNKEKADKYRLASLIQATMLRRVALAEWHAQRPAAIALERYARARLKALYHARLVKVVDKLQTHCRARALVFETRRHRRTVAKLLDHARACLSRRFYAHILASGDNIVWGIHSLPYAQRSLPVSFQHILASGDNIVWGVHVLPYAQRSLPVSFQEDSEEGSSAPPSPGGNTR
ncbi:hypothetical protein T484DRAFT_1875916 [Baffinella frigidus]|nr:hypothetical protein T484DRAFT_1875916 [Cryptophyta sp. CCMP2293]